MAHYTGFYVIKVGVCKTNRIARDPIVKVISVPAQLKNHYSGDTRECIYPPGLGGQGLFPGVWKGMWVIRPSDAKLS
jgi:hypothetical protein